jgi:hypothetical protein
MRTRFVTFALASVSMALHAADFQPFDGIKPIAVLIQTDPWAMVLNSDTPRVAIYEDGTIIFQKNSKQPTYYQKKLSETELADLKKRFLPVIGLKNLKGFYELSTTTDQPEERFYLCDGGVELATRIYGLGVPGPKPVVDPSFKPDKVPQGLLELHRLLCSLDYSGSRKWIPKYVEVMVWPYDYAPEASIMWPKDWPSLDSDHTIKRGKSYSIFLDGDKIPELQKFLRTRKEKGAVEIGGKKWAVSFRPVFPSEPVWRKAIRKAVEK